MARPRAHDRLHDRHQQLAITHPIWIRSEARVLRQLRLLCDATELRELSVVPDRQNHGAIGRGEHLVGYEIGVGVAVTPRHRARAPVIERLIGGERDDRVEEREVDPLADTAPLPPGESGGDREARIHAAQHVAHGDADFLRSPAAIVPLAGDAHEAAQSLEEEVVAGASGVRT